MMGSGLGGVGAGLRAEPLEQGPGKDQPRELQAGLFLKQGFMELRVPAGSG